MHFLIGTPVNTKKNKIARGDFFLFSSSFLAVSSHQGTCFASTQPRHTVSPVYVYDLSFSSPPIYACLRPLLSCHSHYSAFSTLILTSHLLPTHTQTPQQTIPRPSIEANTKYNLPLLLLLGAAASLPIQARQDGGSIKKPPSMQKKKEEKTR